MPRKAQPFGAPTAQPVARRIAGTIAIIATIIGLSALQTRATAQSIAPGAPSTGTQIGGPAGGSASTRSPAAANPAAANPAAAITPSASSARAPDPSPATSDLCVICQEPAAVYRCRAEGAEPNLPPIPGTQIKCVTEISQRSGHGRCRIDKASTGTACVGQFVTVTAPSPPLQARTPTGAALEATRAVAAQPNAPAETVADKPPETMEALAKDAARKSTQAVKDTSSAVGGALKKSWDCVTSLFKGC